MGHCLTCSFWKNWSPINDIEAPTALGDSLLQREESRPFRKVAKSTFTSTEPLYFGEK